MTGMLRGASGAVEIDCILRFESLDADATALFARIGLQNRTLPHRNLGLRDRDWRRYYAEEPDLIDLVGNFFREDAETFSYRFPR